jgi:hypothetical protein
VGLVREGVAASDCEGGKIWKSCQLFGEFLRICDPLKLSVHVYDHIVMHDCERFCISDNQIQNGSALMVQQKAEVGPASENLIAFYTKCSMCSNHNNSF